MPGVDATPNENWTPHEFIDYINQQYTFWKAKGVSRMSVEWGLWSREMNLVLRKLTTVSEHKEEKPTRYKYCFAYWINRSQLLEYHRGPKFLYTKQRKLLTKQGAKIRYAATDDPQPAELAGFMQLAKNDAVTKLQSGDEDGGDN